MVDAAPSKVSDSPQELERPEPSPQELKPSPSPKKSGDIDKSAGTQRERLKLIDDLIREGVFKSHRRGKSGVVRVVVTPKFKALDFDQKNAFVGVIYAYYFDSTAESNLVIVEDSKTGNDIGSFSSVSAGLRMK